MQLVSPRARRAGAPGERFRPLTDQRGLCLYLIDLEGRLLEVNDAFLALLDFPREELLGRELLAWVAQADRAAFLDFLREIVGGGAQRQPLECGLRRRDGATVHLETGGTLIFREGTPLGVQAAGYDVSARRRRQEALAESERKYRRLVESAHEGILVVQDGRIQYANPRAMELIGSPHDADGLLPVFVDPDDSAMVFERCRASPSGQPLPHVCSFKIVDESGHPRWVEISAVTFSWEGRPATLNILSDITQRKRSEAAVRKSEEQYRLLVENAHEAIFILQNGRVKFHNLNTEQLTGRSGEKLASSAFSQWVDPEDRGAVIGHLHGVLQGRPVPGPHAFRLGKGNGETVWAEANVVRVTWEENPALLCFVRDISGQKALEAQLRQAQKMEAIGRLTGGVAHDFNNAMTAVIGFSDVLMTQMGKDHPSIKHLAEIKRAGTHAATLTRQLLAFSSKQVLHPQVLNPNDIIGGMEKIMRRLIGEDIQLVTEPDPVLGNVKADPGQMEQVLLNLVINARDAMPSGGQISIRTRHVHLDEAHAARHVAVRPGPYVEISLTDTGTGMDEATRSRIFEPFFTTKEPGKGTGLGLATVYGIVKQSGGHIRVDSEPGRGTTFQVYLPRVQDALSRAEPSLPAPETAPSGSETVLVVEDESGIRQLISDLLRENGYQVLAAPDPGDALRIGAHHAGRIHLTLTDVVMPQMSGKEMAERLVSSRADMKVIYMSGYTDEDIFRHGILEPGIHFLEKPFTPLTLLRKVRQVLDGQEQRAA